MRALDTDLVGLLPRVTKPAALVLTLNSTSATLRIGATMATFGAKIQDLRKQRRLTQRQLADRVGARLRETDRRGFDFTYLSKIENDRMGPPSVPAIMALAEELKIDSDELLALAGKAPPDLGQKLKESAAARQFYRSALDMNLSDDDWEQMLRRLREGKEQ